MNAIVLVIVVIGRKDEELAGSIDLERFFNIVWTNVDHQKYLKSLFHRIVNFSRTLNAMVDGEKVFVARDEVRSFRTSL